MDPRTDMTDEARKLQADIAMIEIASRRGSGMPELQVLKAGPLKLTMQDDKNHALPHLHVDYNRQFHVASFAIEDGRQLAGAQLRKYERAIVKWIAEHRERLLEIWGMLRSGMGDPHIVIADLGPLGDW